MIIQPDVHREYVVESSRIDDLQLCTMVVDLLG
jgi:hypothetical protein